MPIVTTPLNVEALRASYRYDPASGDLISLHWNRVVRRTARSEAIRLLPWRLAQAPDDRFVSTELHTF